MDSYTNQEAPRKGLQMCGRQSAMTVMLPMLHMDQLTIKISKAITVAYWQQAQLFAPVSPALHMSLEWITLACARHISPFHTMMYSSNISAKDHATHFNIRTRKENETVCCLISLWWKASIATVIPLHKNLMHLLCRIWVLTERHAIRHHSDC